MPPPSHPGPTVHIPSAFRANTAKAVSGDSKTPLGHGAPTRRQVPTSTFRSSLPHHPPKDAPISHPSTSRPQQLQRRRQVLVHRQDRRPRTPAYAVTRAQCNRAPPDQHTDKRNRAGEREEEICTYDIGPHLASVRRSDRTDSGWAGKTAMQRPAAIEKDDISDASAYPATSQVWRSSRPFNGDTGA
ncbi:hypothetical protein BJ912DRAFT_239427 [Pholiota molesta]|nr:hypothetical protein BJ912DRAFT_239427 [Pholiota molesta]